MLYCLLFVHPEHLQSYGGSLLNNHQCGSIHLDDATAATGKRRQCIYHTPATGGEERGSKSQSSGWGLLGGHADKGQWREFWPGVTPLYFYEKSHGFLIICRESGPRLTSHPKDGAFLQYSVPITILGCKDPHRPQVEHPLLASLKPFQQ